MLKDHISKFFYKVFYLPPNKQMLNGFIFFKKSVIPEHILKTNNASTITNIKGTSTPTIAKIGVTTY